MTHAPDALYQQSWPEGEYRFFQLGFVVDDIVAAALQWVDVHGVGPFLVSPVIDSKMVVAGEAAPLAMQVALAQAGPVQIELIQQHSEGRSIFRDWGSPFHQLATITDDVDGRVRHLQERGYELVGEITTPELKVAYVDTTSDFGFYSEIVSTHPAFLARWQSVSDACATWDGTDPVRFETRHGYRVP